MDVKIAVGLDPGSRNHGWAVLKMHGNVVKSMQGGVLRHPLNSLKPQDIDPKVVAYRKEIKRILKGADHVTIERFQMRGGGGQKGALIENVGVMIGLTVGICKNWHICYFPVMASSWKTKWNRTFERYDLERVYRENSHLPTHTIDAVLMSIYGIRERQFDINLQQVLRMLEKMRV